MNDIKIVLPLFIEVPVPRQDNERSSEPVVGGTRPNCSLCKTYNVLLCVFRQPRVDNSSAVPNWLYANAGGHICVCLGLGLGLWRLTPLSTVSQLNHAFGFIGGGNRSTRENHRAVANH